MSIAYGLTIPITGLDLYLDVLNSRSYPGSGTSFNDLSTNRINHTLSAGVALTSQDGVQCFDCAATGRVITRTSVNYTLPASYTMVSWARCLTDAQVSTWRTLWRHSPATNNHPFLVQKTTNLAGMWISSTFRSFGYNISTAGLEAKWTMWTITASGGSSSLFVNDGPAGNTIAYSVSGGVHRWIGNLGDSSNNQPWGYVATGMLYNRALSNNEITQLFNATRGRFAI